MREIKSFFNGNTETQSNNREIKGSKIVFGNEVFTVLKRKNELDKKPQYYLLNLESKVFLSSLYTTGETNTYLFDVRPTHKKYLLRFSFNGNSVTGYEIEEIK